MHRRDVLAASGALTVAALAGCTDGALNSPDTDSGATNSSIDLPTGTATAADEQLAELATGNATFGLELYHQLVGSNSGNLFLSPYSVSAALAMTYAGARGETRQEMTEVFEFTQGEAVHPAVSALREQLASREDVPEHEYEGDAEGFQLDTANALWGQSGYPFANEFLDVLEANYGAGLREASFRSQPSAERQRINDWVAARTEGRIDELLPSGSISYSTRLVLTNAIYFLAGWEETFDAENTEEGTFTARDGSESTVPLMETHLESTYANVDGLEAVELPYVGEDVSMVLLLPEEGTFQRVEGALDGRTLLGVFDELGWGKGSVVFPRIEFESSFQLSEALSELGMSSAFGSAANFAGMREEEGGGLFIDEVYHDTFLSIDEAGTEAAGATAVVMGEETGGGDEGPPDWGELRFDRPFLFCIRDRPTDSVLFLGRVVDGGSAALDR